jgi:hypothetical protein
MRRSLLPLGLAALFLGACGGGGGSVSFVGDFWWQMPSFGEPPQIGVGLAIADGEGIVTGLNGPLPRTYVLAADRTLTIFTRDPPPTAWLLGGLSQDGHVFGAASVYEDLPPLLSLGVRRSEGFSPGDLSGPYHVGLFEVDSDLDVSISGWGTAELDTGVASYGLTVNYGGDLIDVPVFEGSYALAPTGEVSLMFPEILLSGVALAGGDLAVCSTYSDSEFSFLVLVRAGPGATVSTLNGPMFLVGVEATADGFATYVGKAVFDGAGGVSVQWTRHTGADHKVGDLPEEVGTYAVGAGSELLVTLPSRTLSGGVTPTGRFATLAGGTSEASDPSWFFLFR